MRVRTIGEGGGRTAGGGGLNKGFDEGPHSHIAAGVEGTGSGGGGGGADGRRRTK